MPELPHNSAHEVRIPDEATLVQRAADGDQAAFSRLYDYYYPRLYTSIAFIARSHEDAQEIIHETFLKIWKTRESLAFVRSFKDYAYTLARNLLFNQLKRKKINQRAIQTLSDQSILHTGSSPEQELLYKQYYQAAIDAVNQLTPQKKQVFLLRTQEGLSLEKIAGEMGISVSAVKKHLYAALESVKKALRQKEGDMLLFLLLYFF